MGRRRRCYFSCNGESSIVACDPYNWDCKKISAAAADGPDKLNFKIRTFAYSELVAATGGFAVEGFLGKGSHGNVYKAFLDGGRLVAAVKRTKNRSSTGGCAVENEIEILSRVRSPRFVNLIGFCNDAAAEKLLVVEYMPNGCFYDLLHKSRRPPGWSKRIGFALQIGKAVRTLHALDPPVIHRDIKSSNVLIDEGGKARLADFGLALRGHVEDVRIRSTPPAGTLGYLDPAYLAPADISAKSDVFSFGILMLEIISGRKAIDVHYSPPSIVDWAMPLIRRQDFGKICDTRIEAPADMAVVRQTAVLAARCVRSDTGKRPDMMEVVERLAEVWEMVQSGRVWGHLRRRVGRLEAVEQQETAAAVSSAEKSVANGRRNGKVSNVSNAVNGRHGSGADGAGYHRVKVTPQIVVRSKSVGSGSVRRRQVHNSTVKPTAVISLSKSRSTGGLIGLRPLNPYRDLTILCKYEDGPIRIQTRTEQSDRVMEDEKLLRGQIFSQEEEEGLD